MIAYLDNAATTRVLPCARDAALLAMTDCFGNPGSLHGVGKAARDLLQTSRAQVAAALGCSPACITFTSGGSESTNTALRGAAHKTRRIGKHIVSTAVEHEATLNTLRQLQQEGYEVTLIQPERDGNVPVEKVIAAFREDTVLLSMMAVCNETGAVLPVAECAAALKRIQPGALVHVDAVQAFCKIPLDLQNVDLMSLSAHKIGGVKGVGALYVKNGLALRPLIYGGGQENGLRSGTEPLPQIAAFGTAAEYRSRNFAADSAHMTALRERLMAWAKEQGFSLQTPDVGAPHIVNLSPKVGRSEVYIRALSDKGICVSGGSACARGKQSHVLSAMRVDKKALDAALRVSLCPETTEEEITAFCTALLETMRLF